MATNFHMLSCENKDGLHLKLKGDFDGTSACELLETLKSMVAVFIRSFLTRTTLKPFIHSAKKYFKRNPVRSNSNPAILSLLGKMDVKFHKIKSSFMGTPQTHYGPTAACI